MFMFYPMIFFEVWRLVLNVNVYVLKLYCIRLKFNKCIIFVSRRQDRLSILYTIHTLYLRFSAIFCPYSISWPGLLADCRARIVGFPGLQTNTKHWAGARPDPWPAADHWPAPHCHPPHICMLGGPGWGCRCDVFSCLGSDFAWICLFISFWLNITSGCFSQTASVLYSNPPRVDSRPLEAGLIDKKKCRSVFFAFRSISHCVIVDS